MSAFLVVLPFLGVYRRKEGNLHMHIGATQHLFGKLTPLNSIGSNSLEGFAFCGNLSEGSKDPIACGWAGRKV